MVGKYTRKSKRQSWDEPTRQLAINGVKTRETVWLPASKMLGINNIHFVGQHTLRGKATNKNKNIHGSFSSYIWRAFRARTSWSLDTSGLTFVWLDMHRSKTDCKIPLFKMTL